MHKLIHSLNHAARSENIAYLLCWTVSEVVSRVFDVAQFNVSASLRNGYRFVS